MEVAGDLCGVEVQQISSYGDCSLAVSADGELFGWGNSEYLQLSSVTEATQVRQAELEEEAVKVTITTFHFRSALLDTSL